MEKEIKINIPEGYEIDNENSTFECVRFKKFNQDFEYVDLGLPSGTLWATCNAGAKKPEEYGYNMKWEDAQKYTCPSKEQIDELINECKWIWCKINEVIGYLVIGKNCNHIFLPSTFFKFDGSHKYTRYYGLYWSNTSSKYLSVDYAYNMYFDSNIIKWRSEECNYYISVRPVKNE